MFHRDKESDLQVEDKCLQDCSCAVTIELVNALVKTRHGV